MPDTTTTTTETPSVIVDDVAAPYADMPPELHLKAFGRPYTGPDWRFTMAWPDGGRCTLWAGATAADVVASISRQNEFRRVHAEILAEMAGREAAGDR